MILCSTEIMEAPHMETNSPSFPISFPPVARLHLTARTDTPLALPIYAGSMLRGAFGHALHSLAIESHVNGHPCLPQDNCPYCQVFAPPPLIGHSLQKFSQMPAPYVSEPPSLTDSRNLAKGEPFQFNLVLIGKAWQHLPTIIKAFELAMRDGLGRHSSRATLISVHLEDGTPFWLTGQPYPSLQPGPMRPAPTTLAGHVVMNLLTPLRLQYKNRPARLHDLNARALLVALARRHQLLLDVYHGAQAPTQDFTTLSRQAESITLDTRHLRWFDWERYSNRQRQTMKLGGLLGPLHLQGNLAPFEHLLHLGQWLHVGKETVFGLGGYRLQTAPDAPA